MLSLLLYRPGTWGLEYKVTGPTSHNQLVEYQQGFSARPHLSFAVSLPGRAGVCEWTQAWGCGEHGWLHKQHGLLGGVPASIPELGTLPPQTPKGLRPFFSLLAVAWPGFSQSEPGKRCRT